MPKRRNRSSYSVSPRKSPRKSNTTANSTSGGGDKDDDEEKEPIIPIRFKFVDEELGGMEEEEVTISSKLELMCLNVGVKESENENEMPCDHNHDIHHRAFPEPDSVSNRSLQQLLTANASSSPSKRASPLSPTLLDNVQLQQQQVQAPMTMTTVPPPLESPLPPNESNDVPPKVESDLDLEGSASASINSRPRRKRRRIISESPVKPAPAEVTEEASANSEAPAEPPTPTTGAHSITDTPTPTSRLHKRGTSQKLTLRSPPEPQVPVELPKAVFRILDDYNLPDMDPPMEKDKYLKWIPPTKDELCRMVLYELDEVDIKWLAEVNRRRRNYNDLDIGEVSLEEMELLLDRMEKEYYFELQNSGLGQPGESDEDAVCCICLIGESENTNQIIFCDMCNIPVHQDCYGVPFIPEGSWLCRRCQISPHGELECIFCPIKDGALKQTVDGRWAHVLCALWIPEVRFANPSLVEPVDDIDDIPAARWKLTCFLCKKKGIGACIQCHLRSCVTAFHVTCAQAAGLSLKYETKDTSNGTQVVRMSASCDKHTSQRDRDSLTQKWATVNTVLNEKRCAPVKADFPVIPQDRLQVLSELVSFPGKFLFLKRLYSYWKLKRKDKGGAPLIRNLELVWAEGTPHPASPEPIMRPDLDEDTMMTYYENMSTLNRGMTKLKAYCSLVKEHATLQREDMELRTRQVLLQIEQVDEIYLEILDKLSQKDKHGFFKDPVTEEDAPNYFEVVTQPMDLSTMRKKVLALEYSSLEELESDFELMINNCTAYNKKSTVYFKTAIKLRELSLYIFQEARDAMEQREKNRIQEALEEEERKKKKLIQKTLPETFFKTEIKKKEKDYESLKPILTDLLNQLQKRDVHDIFAEPVDTDEVPDYLSIVECPMDFSTMRNKIECNDYSSIEDFEKDFELVISNCLKFNDDATDYYQEALKLKKFGGRVISKAKVKYEEMKKKVKVEIPQEVENNNNEDFIMNVKKEETSTSTSNSSEEPDLLSQLYEVLEDTIDKLYDRDDQEIFREPVDPEEYPDYYEQIQTPMDLSLMKKKLDDLQYTSVDELESDFNLMIDNCKKYNPPRSVYYGIAKLMKTAGDKIFRAARKRLSSS